MFGILSKKSGQIFLLRKICPLFVHFFCFCIDILSGLKVKLLVMYERKIRKRINPVGKMKKVKFSVYYRKMRTNMNIQHNDSDTSAIRARSYAVITGASSGLGASFAERFAREGYSLVLVARRTERLEELRRRLKQEMMEKQEIVLISADLSQTSEVQRVFAELGNRRILFFINNAGFGECGYFLGTDTEKELSMIDVNIKAVHLATKLALQRMEVRGKGYVLNVASSAGLIPAGPYMAAYYATKAYVASLTRAVAVELRERKSNLYIGALCPGPVDTEFNETANVKSALKGISADDCVDYAVDMMKKRKVVIVPSVTMQLAVNLGRLLPQSVYIQLTAHQQKKKMS